MEGRNHVNVDCCYPDLHSKKMQKCSMSSKNHGYSVGIIGRLSLIQKRYIDGEKGIKKHFAAFHLHDPAPVSVIMDDFADIFWSRYRAVTSACYQGAVGVMLVYKLTKRQSFDHMARWLEELNGHAGKNMYTYNAHCEQM
ncbi:Ras-related protein RGP1 [Capsicum annuum]|uniref:Ras-related protein RGP1 n=1 Tax=Capsicum annuum TaxID=4072 RepID=A0A2G2YP43_CAPAN|nr:Ras-related protein RGP1 [Capsicum annuum]